MDILSGQLAALWFRGRYKIDVSFLSATMASVAKTIIFQWNYFKRLSSLYNYIHPNSIRQQLHVQQSSVSLSLHMYRQTSYTLHNAHTQLQSYIRGWLIRRRWKRVVRDYLNSPQSDVLKKRNQVQSVTQLPIDMILTHTQYIILYSYLHLQFWQSMFLPGKSM